MALWGDWKLSEMCCFFHLLQLVMINRDGYVSVLDDDGHLRSDLIVDDDEMKTTLTKKMNSDNDADIIVSLTLFFSKACLKAA